MAVIREEDLIGLVAEALHVISVFHPADDVRNLAEVWLEESRAARGARGRMPCA